MDLIICDNKIDYHTLWEKTDPLHNHSWGVLCYATRGTKSKRLAKNLTASSTVFSALCYKKTAILWRKV